MVVVLASAALTHAVTALVVESQAAQEIAWTTLLVGQRLRASHGTVPGSQGGLLPELPEEMWIAVLRMLERHQVCQRLLDAVA